MAAGNGDGSLKEQVRGLFEDRNRHQKNLDELFTKYEGVGRTNWQIVLSAIGVLVLMIGGLWGLTASPMNEDIKRHEKTIARHEATIADQAASIAVLKTETTQIKETQRVFRELMRRVEDERLPTREFTIHQAANASDKIVVQRQITELSTKIDAVFPPSKVLEDLVRRLSELERTRALTSTKP